MLNSTAVIFARIFTAQVSFPRRLPRLAMLCALVLTISGCDNGGSGSGGDIALDDSKVYEVSEEFFYSVIPGTGTSTDVTVESWRWGATPLRTGALAECSSIEGFDSSLAATSLTEACTDSTRCNFTFDQFDINNDDGTTSPRFIVAIPKLQAPVGLNYELFGLTDRAETVSTNASFCLVPTNDPPMAVDDSFTVTQGEVLEITGASAIDLLSNDVDDLDRSNQPLSVSVTPLVSPQFATQFSLRADGGFTYSYDGDLGIQGSDQVVDTFRYQISDGFDTSEADVRIIIVSRDNPPTLTSAIPSHTAVAGIPTEFDFSASFTDPEGSQLQYSVVQDTLPANSNFQVSVLGVLTGTATQDNVGNYTVTAVASDGGLSASGSFLLSIIDNQLPTVQAIADQAVDFGTLINLDVSGSFQDPEQVPLTFSLSSTPTTDLIINPESGLITGNLTGAGTFTITVSASDGFNDAVSTTFQITQGDRPNRAPVFSGTIANQGILLGQTPAPVTGDFSDLDDDTLTYSISSLPQGMNFDANTGTLSGTPEQLGNFTLTITATDPDGATANSNAFTIAVSEVPNEPPTFNGQVQNQVFTEGVTITPFTAEFADPENNALSYTSTQLPNGLQLNAATGEVTGTPSANSAGVFTITITAQDDAGNTATSNSFTITVNEPPNVAPTFSGTIADVTVTVGTAISPISGNFSDNDTLTYSSTALPDGITLNSTTGVLTGTANTIQTVSVSLTATDPSGDSATSNTFVIDVIGVPNNAPVVLNPIPAQSAVAGSAITSLDVSGFFNDIDAGDTLTFSVSTGNPLPAGLTLSATGVISGTPSATGAFSVVIIATDDDGASVSSAPFNYTITNANVAPVISNRTPSGTINLTVGETVTIEFDVTDETPATVTYAAGSSTAAASLVTVANGEYEVSGASAGSSTLTFTVTDAQGLSDTETVSVNVTAAVDNPPQIDSVSPSEAVIAVASGSPLSMSVIASDESVATLAYTATSSNTAVASVTAGTGGNYTITANPASPGGSSTITLTVTDGANQSASYSFIVTVAAPNSPPVFTGSIGNQTYPEGVAITPLDVSGFFSDPDGDSLTFSHTVLPAGLTMSSAGVIAGTPVVTGTASSTAVTITATDASGSGTGSDSNTFNIDITVAAPNQPPVFTGTITDETYAEGVAISPLDISGFYTDPESDALTFSSTALPVGLSMSAAGVISGTPAVTGTASSTAVTITATDASGSGTGTDSNAFNIIISVTNQPPVFTGAITAQSYPEGVAISPLDVSVFFSDPDGDSLTYGSTVLPVGLTMTSAGVIMGTPAVTGTPSSTLVTVTATDTSGSGAGSDSNSFNIDITVAASNQPPVFTGLIADESYPEGVAISPLDVSGFFSDAESDALTFTDSGLPAGLSMSSAGLITGTPAVTGSASATFVTITATDLLGSATGTDSNLFTISISVI